MTQAEYDITTAIELMNKGQVDQACQAAALADMTREQFLRFYEDLRRSTL